MDTKQEKNLVYLLYEIKEVLDEEMIEFWLECGTLLGAVRDGKIIPWEHDLDFGVFREKLPYSLQELIKEKLSIRGFKVVIYKNHMNISISKSKKTGADISYYDIINENAIVPHRKAKKFIGNLLIMFHSIILDPNKRIDTYKNMSNFKKHFIIFIENIFILLGHMIPYFLRKQIAKKYI